MIRYHILNSREVKRVKELLLEQFGFSGELPYVFLKNNKEKLFITHRDMEHVHMEQLRVDAIGLYFATLETDTIRLSLEGSQIIGQQAKKNIIVLDDTQFKAYITGKEVELKTEMLPGIYIVQHGIDYAGCCKISGKKLTPFIPKSRRLKVLNA
ncbi:MAG: hypothetical protein ABIJ21_07050 [Nanoarchaeota archaeon]